MRRLTLLLLQGPASPFLKDVASVVERQGGSVHKIHFCLGDAVYWYPRQADWFKGEDHKWPDFLKNYIERHGITDILMLGDGRPRHAAAIDVARASGVRAHIFEHGYLRPDWLTIEPFGMSSRSLLPTDPEVIRNLARMAPADDTAPNFPSSFLSYALYDLAYHLPNVAAGWLLHPHYRTHGAVHPLIEYAGWIGKALTGRNRRKHANDVEARYLQEPRAAFFLFPLQLPGDYQIKRHAPIGDHFQLVDAVMTSFSRHAPPDSRLLFKVHPIDNGLSRWSQRIADQAGTLAISKRVDVIDGGNLDRLIGASRGVVTVNSTVGLTAVMAEKPVITLGAAVYDLPGLTWQESLATFWTKPAPPKAGLAQAFAQALKATIQVRGGFIGKAARQIGAENLVARMSHDPDWTSEQARHDRSRFRYEAELLALRT